MLKAFILFFITSLVCFYATVSMAACPGCCSSCMHGYQYEGARYTYQKPPFWYSNPMQAPGYAQSMGMAPGRCVLVGGGVDAYGNIIPRRLSCGYSYGYYGY